MKSSDKTIFGFDVGLGSLGLAVRQGDDIVHADSLLIDAEVAKIADQAERRRQQRTRKTHKQREKWWQSVWQEIGKEPLKGIQLEKRDGAWQKIADADPRLEREFAEEDDDTIYTSCLLRILLLRGEPLADWQIYKAIRSAFRRAGYPDVPWAKGHTDDDAKKEEEEKKEQERTLEFDMALKNIFEDETLRLPCYYDAYQMGLFDPATGEINPQQTSRAKRARGYTASRDLVQKELWALLEQAAKQLPALKTVGPNPQKWQEYILFGPGFEAFNDTKIEGVLDQKVAQFDNRCVNPCSCIPRFKVCRAKELLYFQANFLLKLRNMLVEKDQTNQKLTTEEIGEWYEAAEEKRKEYMQDFFAQKAAGAKQKVEAKDLAKCYKITKTDWKKWCQKKGYAVYTATCEIPAPKLSGRTGFSRPALALLRALILSGKPPHDFRQALLAQDFAGFEGFKLQEADLDFLLRMKENNPEKIYIAPPTLVQQHINRNTGDLEAAAQKIIGSTRNSVVRHRLEVFFKQLKRLEAEWGAPSAIVVEFAREDFSSEKKKKDYTKVSNEHNKVYEEAKSELSRIFGANYRKEHHLVRKYIMWKKQDEMCPFTGQHIAPSELQHCEIEHIIPRGGEWNGPDSIENTVLTTRTENKKKGSRMPFQYIAQNEWESFKNRVEGMKIGGKTKKILLCRSQKEAEELIERYYGLAITGWVARLARDIACVWFGWQPGAEGESRKMHTVSGSLVAKVRRKYGLNKALNPFLADEEAKKDKKNRDDDRHHALDAMVMTYLNEYMRNPRNFDALQLPEKVRSSEYFAEKLEAVTPHKIARNKAQLGETAYRVIEKQEMVEKRGKKVLQKEKMLVGRVDIANANPKNILDGSIRQRVGAFLATSPSKEQKEAFFANFRGKNGALIKKVMVKKGKPDNLVNLSKNPQARGQYYESKSIMGVGTLQHGYYLYSRDAESWKVWPVYAFLSPHKEKQRLLAQGYQIKDNRLFYAGCIIQITEYIEAKDVDIGKYIVMSVKHNGVIKLKNNRGEIFEFSISYLGDDFYFFQ